MPGGRTGVPIAYARTPAQFRPRRVPRGQGQFVDLGSAAAPPVRSAPPARGHPPRPASWSSAAARHAAVPRGTPGPHRLGKGCRCAGTGTTRDWANANIHGLPELTAAPALRITPRHARADLQHHRSAVQIGTVLAYLRRGCWASTTPSTPRPRRLLLVARTSYAVQRGSKSTPSDFAMWVCLH